MITTVVIESVEEGLRPPTGNGFPVCVHRVHRGGPWLIDSGLSFEIPRERFLRLESVGQFIVTGWTLKDGRLFVLVDSERRPMETEQVASAWILAYEKVSLRFVQKSPFGGRLIRGDAKVADCVESRGSEPGE